MLVDSLYLYLHFLPVISLFQNWPSWQGCWYFLIFYSCLLSLFLCVRGGAFVCIICFLAAKYWPASWIDTGPLAIAAAPLFTWSATIEQYFNCFVSHSTVLCALKQHSGYSWYAELQNTWSMVRCMKWWGSFGTGYCCGCIGVFWLSIKANVYVQYQKETRTSKIWISTTPRHQV